MGSAKVTKRLGILAALALVTAVAPRPAAAADGDVLVEFHFMPVPGAQIAIWLEDSAGRHVQDVMVTQATGTLGIGNRPGRWDFLSSWRFPYGDRPSVLPIWAHARGKTYPKLTFHDDDAGDLNSLGWHENSSSLEPYFCRPLTDTENETIATDTMTCPSPSVFQSDKGRFSEQTTPYPPRGDLVTFEDGGDHPDVKMFGSVNDLDAITSATPIGDELELVTAIIPSALADDTLTARIEISLEHDENKAWGYDRETDHYVDPRLSGYGIEYLGQPSVVYSVEFDPAEAAFVGTDMYAGYGDWDGKTGTMHPPDDSISIDGGSGADRLQLCTHGDETFRFGVFSHGAGSGEDPTGSGGSDCGDGGDDGGPMGGCTIRPLPSVTDLELEAMDFDHVRVHFTLPDVGDTEIRNVRLYYRAGEMALGEDNLASAIQSVPRGPMCSGPFEPGATMWCDVDQLFGNFEYQMGLKYEDSCSNRSALATETITTPAQKFQTVEGICFVATAAWGAQWTDRVRALRHFRDVYLRKTGTGEALIQFYYAHSPMLAGAIASRPWARALTRAVIGPMADIAQATTGS